MTSERLEPPTGRRRAPWPVLGVVCVAWFGFFALTPGLLDHGVGSLLSADFAVSVLIETGVVAVLGVGLLLTNRSAVARLLGRSRTRWAYAVPAVALLLLPLHFGLGIPFWTYVVWITASVIWQDLLTFGLLQSSLRRHLPAWSTVLAVAILFSAAHVLLLPDRFLHVLPWIAMLALGAVLAAITARLGTLHLVLALHLAFYFIAA